MDRRSFLKSTAAIATALGATTVARALTDDGTALAARRGYPGPVPTCAPGYTKDCSFGCQCYCIPANVCGSSCCNPAAQTCEVVGIDPDTGDPILGCVVIPE